MTPPDLAKCANCDCWFAVAATDEVFHHATKRCRKDVATGFSPSADPHEHHVNRTS
ncbi:MAG TPA: hypothetical protein VEO54_27235 [Thermoanaerobaculia bacterium]|nr:hypothetical protein [Thermoanaerobaculia bacterium]